MTKVVDMADAQPKRLVPAIDRAVMVLDLIAAEPGVAGVSELARRLGLAKSSVHGICDTLCALGLLRVAGSGFEMGPRSLHWSASFLDRSDLVSEFERILSEDRRLDDYTVTLSTLSGAEVMYLACRNAAKPLGFTFQLGMRLPAIYTATGKAMLSQMESEQRQALLAGPWPAAFTANSVASLEALEGQFSEWRQLGYALDRGEIRDGMVCLGAAVKDRSGKPVAGIAISMTSAEASAAALKDCGVIVGELAAKLMVR
ncbi:IclR family transcriptional regulator [Gallaecimonas pentaromativorans]|uniref:HTH-type transcriptional repressor AllR n=1 Tax=Gallaecimonas pentaromativorans TaxID=584787 RepID=A0A3N1PAU0_9GAMM|nr:IclR family transcriptional regulator [Gallaecimonas pentaromativorans]ROQ24878.1 IclR family transcriptional regulator [Gallaecimonas pentaromativorans]